MSAPASIQVDRELVMDSTFPFYMEEAVVLYRKPSGQKQRSFFFLRPFKWQVFSCIAVAVLGVGIVAWMMGFIESKPKRNGVLSLSDLLWASYGAVFNQSKCTK